MQPNTHIVLVVSGLKKEIQNRIVINAIDFSMGKNQHFALAGETGSGKTTLLKLIAGLEQPDFGTILFDNKRVLGSAETLVPGHPKIGYLSQFFELRNQYKIEDLLSYASKISEQEANEIYHLCKIQHLINRKTHQVSGGEKQRIALAKILVGSPSLLLLDEPFSNLDPENKRIMKEVLANLAFSMQLSILLSTHDPLDSLPWADQILVLEKGNLIQKACPRTLYHHPISQYAAALFGHYSLVNESDFRQIFNHSKPPFPKEKLLMLRPTDYQIEQIDQEREKNAQVVNCLFAGPYFEITLQFQNVCPKLVLISPIPYEIGSQIALAYTGSDPCFL